MRTCVVHSGSALVLAAIFMTSGVPAEAGKPTKPGGGGGSTTDPCAASSPSYGVNWDGFPAYAYVINTTTRKNQSFEVRVASRNGVCSRRVGNVGSGRASTRSFAYSPGQGKYILVYWDVYEGRLAIATFPEPEKGQTTAISAQVSQAAFYSTSADLSPDGSQLAYTTRSDDGWAEIRIGDPWLGLDPISDPIVQTYQSDQSWVLWWSPWGEIYYQLSDSTDGERIAAIDPAGTPPQEPEIVLQIPSGFENLEVGQLFALDKVSGGYTGQTKNIVFQGAYHVGGSGAWCPAAYSLDADTGEFLLGSPTEPSPIVGFRPSVTSYGTVLVEGAVAGGSCGSAGYLVEGPLADGYSTWIVGQPMGTYPAALKSQ